MDVRRQLAACTFDFELRWGLQARIELVRLGRILSDWRAACRIHGHDDELCLREFRKTKAYDGDLQALRSVGLLEHARFFGVSGFHSHLKEHQCDVVVLGSHEDGGDAEALARLLSLVMWKHTRETGNKVVFTFAGRPPIDEYDDRSPQGGVVMVTPTGYRVQTLSDLAKTLASVDFWPVSFPEAQVGLEPSLYYLLPQEMRLGNRLPDHSQPGAAGTSGPSL